MRTILARSLSSLRERGLVETALRASSIVEERLFDLRYGTDTVSLVRLRPEAVSSPNASKGVDYQPTRIRPFRKMLAAMNPGFDSVLVDYGCGKGRTLLIAAECGFSRSVGIEFVPALIEVARLNVAKYRQKTGSKVDIQIVEADAAEYDVQDDQTHYYFYNPFNADVLRQVLQRITESLKRIPRRVCVIYNNPQHGDVVEAAGFYPTMHYERREIVIYSNYPPSVVPECGKLY